MKRPLATQFSPFAITPANVRFGQFRTFQSTCSNRTKELTPLAKLAPISLRTTTVTEAVLVVSYLVGTGHEIRSKVIR
jgi:NAD-dependent DNA ligase